jgi:hypothetical protein
MKKILFIIFFIVMTYSVFSSDLTVNQTLPETRGGTSYKYGNYFYASGIGYHSFSWQVSGGAVSTCTGNLESSPDAINWTTIIADQNCATNGKTSPVYGFYNFIRMRLGNTYTVSSGTPVIELQYVGNYDNNEIVDPGDYFEYYAKITNTSWATIKAPSAGYYYVVTICKVVNADTSVGTEVTFYEDDDGDIGDSVAKDGGYADIGGGGWVSSNPNGVFSTGTANRGLYVVCTTDSSETHVTIRGYRTRIKPAM